MRKGAVDSQDRLLEESAHASRQTADNTTRRLRSTQPDTDDIPWRNDASAGIGFMPQTPEVYNEEAHQERTAAATVSEIAPEIVSANSLPQRDVLNHANFGLLPEEKGRFGSFGVAAGVNIIIAALLLALTIDQVHEARVHRQEQLVYLAPPPKPYVPPVPKIKMPPIPPLPKEEAKIQPPKPVIEPPKVELPKVVVKAPAMPAPAPRAVVTPPKPIVGAFKSPEAPAQQAPHVATTQAAGFGAPTGVQANPNATRPSQLAMVGAFGAAANSNQGAASRQGAVATTGFGSGAPSGSPNGSARGAVASTGFGSGSQPAGMPGGHGTVASTGFGQSQAAAGGPPVRAQQPVTTQIVVLSKPLPQYTAEARDAHIQGDVTLEVRFTADGQVEVLRVVNGLGHGLDEQARQAAARIRFKPATRDGKATDQVSVIRISFQLA